MFRLFRLVGIVSCVLLFGSTAFAQATRTWVSGVGDDVNPCSRTAPCKTFAGAISKTSAGGEIEVLDSGGFGAVTITKSITIDGGSEIGGILAGSVNGIVVNAPGGIVIIRDLSINGTDSNGANTGLNGIRIVSAAMVIIQHVRIQKFHVGIDVLAGNVLIDDSILTTNDQVGVNVEGGSATVENSFLLGNNVGAQAVGGATLRLSNNGIYYNLTGMSCGGGAGTIASAGNNRKAANSGGAAVPCDPTVAITIK
jgi:hypothetical protein